MNILAINPGSTSTKLAVYHDDVLHWQHTIEHSTEALAPYPTAFSQLEFRTQEVLSALSAAHLPLSFKAIIGRGGLTHPIPAGVYKVNEAMLHDTLHATRQHVCNLGCHIAHALASRLPDCLALIADPVIVDELVPEARLTGSTLMERHSVWHALNQRATARRYARDQQCPIEELRLIVAHLGGGISIGAHEGGRCIDVNNALDGEGPFSPERAGTLPSADLVRLCFSGQLSEAEILKRIAGKAGLVAHLGTADVRHILQRIHAGDEKAQRVLDSMIYHVAKSIAGQSAPLYGRVDAILLTGGLAHAPYITERIAARVQHIAPVHCYPGENELESLAENALRVLRGECQVQTYV